MSPKIFKLAGMFLSFSLLAATSTTGVLAQENVIEVKHVSGTTEFNQQPNKVIAYDLAILDTLDTFGVHAVGVPKGIWPEFLDYYDDNKKYPEVGTLFEPDYEAVNALKPDLIIVAGRSAPKYKDLSRLAPAIDLTVTNGDLVNSVKKNALTLASIFSKQDQAKAEIDKIDTELEAINKKAADVGNAMVILTVGGKISAYGPGSRFGIIHDAFGLQPTVADLENTNHGQAISLEFIYKNDPEWLFVIDRDAAIGTDSEAAQRLLDNDLIHKTKAWQNDQIVYLDPVNWYILGSSGLNSLHASIAEVSKAISK